MPFLACVKIQLPQGEEFLQRNWAEYFSSLIVNRDNLFRRIPHLAQMRQHIYKVSLFIWWECLTCYALWLWTLYCSSALTSHTRLASKPSPFKDQALGSLHTRLIYDKLGPTHFPYVALLTLMKSLIIAHIHTQREALDIRLLTPDKCS